MGFLFTKGAFFCNVLLLNSLVIVFEIIYFEYLIRENELWKNRTGILNQSLTDQKRILLENQNSINTNKTQNNSSYNSEKGEIINSQNFGYNPPLNSQNSESVGHFPNNVLNSDIIMSQNCKSEKENQTINEAKFCPQIERQETDDSSKNVLYDLENGNLNKQLLKSDLVENQQSQSSLIKKISQDQICDDLQLERQRQFTAL
ncbi:hypothetical protein PPERSA_08276 [Pseudocohnilembus persalinus]|uniref:Transmembrane protein n=1 Tax=Pseudocohnilembus persalinus TaxID=266149 RepID=A0A0V0Q7F1_PSEPJ|nr:hypothetical protein PPERSA_08276 [Pseudocohnilembus persalinus]|eukprot:KRW98113.1 hypothetical protein PPERSA_08276 [Pseudocohnilembus persalinus]